MSDEILGKPRRAGGPIIDASRYSSGFSARNRLARALWLLVWGLCFRISPRPFFGWRRTLLRAFGARIGRGAKIHSSCKIWAPWNLQMGEHSCLAFQVDCYDVEKVTIGEHATVSQYSHLCTASHDTSSPSMALTAAPIRIGRNAWVAAAAFIGPGVEVGEGAVVGARAVVVRPVPPWTIVGGNPATQIGTREIAADQEP
jgi:putative colanic acid biosynthesis acetyltransferase WcaF